MGSCASLLSVPISPDVGEKFNCDFILLPIIYLMPALFTVWLFSDKDSAIWLFSYNFPESHFHIGLNKRFPFYSNLQKCSEFMYFLQLYVCICKK